MGEAKAIDRQIVDWELPASVRPYLDRHGKRRYRFRRNGISRDLPAPDHPEFQQEYEDAVAAASSPVANRRLPRLTKRQRIAFWHYSMRAAERARSRSRELSIPFDLDQQHIYNLFTEQRWRCAISGIEFEPPPPRGGRSGPFSPSLDRAIPAAGYVKGNVRLVVAIVNGAMSDWGLEPLLMLTTALNSPGNWRT